MGRTSVFGGLGCVLAASAFLAGCGGTTSFDWDSGSATFTGTTVTSRAAVVAADVDGDGRADLIGLGRDGRGEAKCWRNRGDGAYADATEAWSLAAGVRAIRVDCDGRDDAGLEGDLGVHRADCPQRSDLPYALLHLGDGAGEPLGPPVLEGVEPGSGDARSVVSLVGSDLASSVEPTTVAFGGVPAQVLFAFPDRVLAVVPDGLGLGSVAVTLSRGAATAGPVAFTVVLATAPQVDAVEPTTLAPGVLAVVRGLRLGTPLDEVTVTFSGAPAEHALPLEDLLFAVVPAGAASGPLVVAVNGLSSAPFDVVVGTLAAPAIAAVLPASASPGSLVRIEGADLAVLGERTVVTFGDVPAALATLASGALAAVVPDGAADGDVVVTVGGRASAGWWFDVVARGAPTITSISPASASPGRRIAVRGTDLVDLSAWKPDAPPPVPLFGDLEVTVAGKPAWLVWPTHEGLEVIVPFDAPAGSGSVRVESGGLASNAFPFTVQ